MGASGGTGAPGDASAVTEAPVASKAPGEAASSSGVRRSAERSSSSGGSAPLSQRMRQRPARLDSNIVWSARLISTSASTPSSG